MYRFMIQRIKKKLLARKKVYIIVVLQLAIGMFLLGFFITLGVNCKNQANELIKTGGESKFLIKAKYLDNRNINSSDTYSTDSVPFTPEEVVQLQKKYADLEIEFKSVRNADIFDIDSVRSFDVVYSSEISESVQMSHTMYNILENNKGVILRFPYTLVNRSLIVEDGAAYPIEYIHEDDIIIMPMEYYVTSYEPKDAFYTMLNIRIQDYEKSTSEMAEILEILTEKHSEFEYSLNNEYYDYLKCADTALDQSEIFTYLMCIILLIITIGISGLFLLITDSRKCENAICMAMGESKFMLCLENYLEVAFLCFTGGGIGSIVSLIPALSKANIMGVDMAYSGKSVLYQLFILLAISIVSTIPSINKLGRFLPVEILKSE